MKASSSIFLAGLGMVFMLAVAQPANVAAQNLSAAEKVFAELAKMSPSERSAKIIEGAKKEGKFRFIHSLRGKIGRNHVALFKKRYPFLNVEMTELGSQDAAERMATEEAAGRHLTDAVLIASADMTELLAKNMAARYPTPETKSILKQYHEFLDKDNRWTPFAINEHGIVYNTNLVKNPPKSYDDLCDARFKKSTSFDPLETRFLVGIYSIFGKDLDKVDKWLECIGKNEPIIQRGHTQRLRLMLSGDHAITPDQYIYSGTLMKKKNPSVPFAAAYAAPVTISSVNGVLNRNTPNPYASALFADWSVGEESQKYLAGEYRGPVAFKHPYFPDDAKLVAVKSVPNDVVDKLQAMWTKHIRKK